MRRSARVVAIVVTCLFADLAALAQAPARVGGEFQVNTFTLDTQTTNRASVGREANGDFVVVWGSVLQDGSSVGVFGQRFASSGAKLGVEFQVNTYTLDIQALPAVTADADGDFVVAWASKGQDGSEYGIFARRFDSSGVALAVELQVNSFTVNRQGRAVVARDADGDFVVAWDGLGQDGSSYGIFARRFDAAGAAQGSEFQVNEFTFGTQSLPAIDLDQDGDFVIVWDSFQDGSGIGVFGQRFNSQGMRQGPEFQVNDFATGDQRSPAVAADNDGDFVVAWQSASQDGDFEGIFAQRFDSSGAPQGFEIQVNAYTTQEQDFPAVGMDADGDFVVAWSSSGQDGSANGVFARHFRSSGVPTGGDILVPTTVANSQFFGAPGFDANGDFVVAWTDIGKDGSEHGVFAQRFDVPALLDIDGNGQLTALTDGVLVVRFLFGFTGTTLAAGAVGDGCMRCDSATILPHLSGLT